MALGEAMARTLTHRGPDSAGVWLSPDGAAVLAHRRLSIIDLSPAGHQPMTSADGRWTISYNGEIYNHATLRKRLDAAGAALRGRSDTEVLLEWISRWGLAEALAAAEGMFAFALWDARERRLHLVRDRIGVKPLYWTKQGAGFAFASEIKALTLLPGARFALDRRGASLYFKFGYTPSPTTIYENVWKLEPGAILTVASGETPRIERYWDAWDYAQPSEARDDAALLGELDQHVRRSVGQELVADVPVGCFLSGGVDSSLVAAAMRQLSGAPVKTFNVAFDDPTIDESAHARAVAAHIGSEHHEIRLDAASAREIIPTLPEMYDEPLSDMAQIPTHLVSKLARQHVKVALSGDGGDELFAGYDRYHIAERVWRRLGWAPHGARRLAARALRAAPAGMVAAAARLSASPEPLRAARRLQRLSVALDDASPLSAYVAAASTWLDPAEVLTHADAELPDAWRRARASNAASMLQFQLIDLHTYLPDDVLAKVDRASMAVSLEVRVPLLNHKLVEFALGLPPDARVRGGESKFLLRRLLYQYVPRALVDRPKRGFSVPMAAWLRGPLRDWADDLLSDAALRQNDVLRADIVSQRWREHRSGAADWSYPLWSVLMFQDWSRRALRPERSA